MLLSIVLETVIGAVTVFYSLLVVTLLVPVLGGLYTPRAGAARRWRRSPPASLTLFVVRFAGCRRYCRGSIRRWRASSRPPRYSWRLRSRCGELA